MVGKGTKGEIRSGQNPGKRSGGLCNASGAKMRSGNQNCTHQGWEQSAGMLLAPKARWDKKPASPSGPLCFLFLAASVLIFGYFLAV